MKRKEPPGGGRISMARETTREAAAAAAPGAGTLVATAGTERPHAAARRPTAAFLAQLLSCRDGSPDHRARRRAEPNAAAERYAARPHRPASRLVATC
jgi:hypothetical protein